MDRSDLSEFLRARRCTQRIQCSSFNFTNSIPFYGLATLLQAHQHWGLTAAFLAQCAAPVEQRAGCVSGVCKSVVYARPGDLIHHLLL